MSDGIPDECSECGERIFQCPCCDLWLGLTELSRYCPSSETGRHVQRRYA